MIGAAMRRSSSPPQPSASTNQPASPRLKLALGAIIVLSFLFRAIYFIQLGSGPCMVQHRFGQWDMNYFDGWAKQIAAGDWLSKNVSVPMHGWHHAVAQQYFQQHPEAVESLLHAATNSAADPDELLWRHWSGGNRFYQDPLYPYLIAITYKLSGADVRHVFIWQMLLGVLSNVLNLLIARRCFGETVGMTAGVLAALCSPLMYYELILLRETLIVFVSLLLVWLLLESLRRKSWPWWLWTGLTLGLSVQLKSTFTLFGLLALLGVVLALRTDRRPLLRSLVGLIGGASLALLPLLVRNVIVGAPPLALASGGTITFISGNAADYPAAAGGFFVSAHAAQIMGESDGKFLPAIAPTLRTHPSALNYLKQSLHKFDSTWHWYEVPNNENFYFYRLYAPILRYLPLSFFILSPLSLVGLFIGVRQSRRAWPLYALIVATAIPLWAFMVMSRLRIPLVAALIPFAALTLVQVARWARARQAGKVIATLAAILVIALRTSRSLPSGQPLIRYADYSAAYVAYYEPQIRASQERADAQRVIDLLREFLRVEPLQLQDAMYPGPFSESDQPLASLFAASHRQLALALEAQGRVTESAPEEERALRLESLARRLSGKNDSQSL